MADLGKVSRALISVTDKTGVVEFAKALAGEFGVEVISTGGTAKVLVEAGVPVVPIEEYTGFPEMMDGRVKTLHPKVHGGLLARRDSEQHMAEAAEHGIGMIDMVVVNLYEFEKTVAKPDVTFIDAIEHIDIGGPSMLRSAAKNADAVTVVSDPADYEAVLAEMRANDGATTLGLRRALQAKVYATTAAYDTAISDWMMAQLEGGAVAAPSATEQFAACGVLPQAREGSGPALRREPAPDGRRVPLRRRLRRPRLLLRPARGRRSVAGQAAVVQQLPRRRGRLECRARP